VSIASNRVVEDIVCDSSNKRLFKWEAFISDIAARSYMFKSVRNSSQIGSLHVRDA
jgi:hypothetical protein